MTKLIPLVSAKNNVDGQKTLVYTAHLFVANESPELCAKFANGHKKVLEDFGVKNVSSDNRSWMRFNSVYCIAIVDQKGVMVGGIRVEASDKNKPLPLEIAIGKMDPSISIIVKGYHANGGVGEICGMWTDRSVAGIGIGVGLVRLAKYVIVTQELSYGMCLVTSYTKKLVMKHGFVVETSVGDDGEFQYPDERYIATVMRMRTKSKNLKIDPYERVMILRLLDSQKSITDKYDNHTLELNIKNNLS